MRGIGKAFSRAPHRITTKVGMAHSSSDAQFDELARSFDLIEQAAQRFTKDAAAYRTSVQNMLISSVALAQAFQTLFSPLGPEGDLAVSYPDSLRTIESLPEYDAMMTELRETLTPEIELIESRIAGPLAGFHAVTQAIRKNITKREHKLVDYDRRKNSYEKLVNKKEKSLNDEKNLFKVEQEFETSMADYEYFNSALKEELPRFFDLAASFVSPVFHSFYYMQLNVMYLTLQHLEAFAEARGYNISVRSGQIEADHQNALGDVIEQLDGLSIRRPATASARVLTDNNRPLGSSRAGSIAKKDQGGLAASAPSKGGSVLGKKKAPPPPVPGKKPGLVPPPEYVVALYDFVAQAEGDLSFSAGDTIELVQRTESQDDWWTGRVDGVQGIFPGNYVRL